MRDDSRSTLVIRWTILAAVTVAVGAALAGVAHGQAQFDRGAAARGADTFRLFCASCHGQQAVGNGPLAMHLRTPPADLTALSENNGGEFPRAMVINTIELGRDVSGHGNPDMPAWADAFEQTRQSPVDPETRVQDLVQFLLSIQD